MARQKATVPAYRQHKGTGQAVCYIDRKEHYLGPFNSVESRQRYARLVSQLTSGDAPNVRRTTDNEPAQRSIAAICLKFIAEKLPGYADAEQDCFRSAMRVLCSLFGETPAVNFGPIALRATRAAMIAGDPHAVDAAGNPKPRKPWSRGFVNREIKRLKYLFRWAVGWELIPQSVADALANVEALKPGETEAADYRPRRAVPDADFAAVRAVLSELHRDILDLMGLTGCRSGELLGLTTGDIDRTGDVWRADLKEHKTRHFGKDRVLFFNTVAQSILKKYLRADPAAKLFPIRRDYFSQVIKAACLKAGVTAFVPHAVRHAVASRLADTLGVESAQRLLGHSSLMMTQHYAKSAERVAIAAAVSLG